MCVCVCVCVFLGHGDNTSRNIPTLVRDISGVGQVVCGSAHTLALSADGRTVWSFGSGECWREGGRQGGREAGREGRRKEGRKEGRQASKKGRN